MLKRFLYLDTDALTDYVSALEDGIRESLERKSTSGRSAEGGVGFNAIKASISGSRNAEESTKFSDTPQARFERLLELAHVDQESAGWVDVADPDTDFASVGVGALIDVECEAYVPEMVKALSPQGGMVEALDQLDAMLPFISSFVPNADQGLPSKNERDAMKGVIGALGGKTLVVGEFESSEWRIAGQLDPSYVKGEVEGVSRIIGKVSNKWPKGRWKPMLALPGSTLLSREQRRAMERQKPAAGEENQYLEGPALMLDILAIYR